MSTFAHFYLSDVRSVVGKNEIDVDNPLEYVLEPFNSRGMLPEYGLATRFNGVTQWATGWDTTAFGPGGSLVVLARPLTATSAGDRCIAQTGGTNLWIGLDSTGHFKFGNPSNLATAIVITPAVAALGEYLVIGTQNPGTGAATLTVYDLLAERPEDETKLAALFGTASGTFATGVGGGANVYLARDTGGHLFDGDIQGFVMVNGVLSGADIAAIRETATWTDVTLDVRADVPITTKRGFETDDPATRLAATGQCTFAMNNASDNTGKKKGYYSPGHANVRDGFHRGIPVRVTLKLDD